MSADRTRRSQSGFTLIELTIGLVLGLVVVMALGQLIIANQRNWEWGRDKVVLQQNSTEALEWMARSVRAAHILAVVDSTEFQTFDTDSNLVHTYDIAVIDGVSRLREDGTTLVERPVTRFLVETDDDTSSVILTLEIEDRVGTRVESMTRAAIRNRTFEF